MWTLALAAFLVAGVLTPLTVRELQRWCPKCGHRSAIRMGGALLYPPQYCVRCRHEWLRDSVALFRLPDRKTNGVSRPR